MIMRLRSYDTVPMGGYPYAQTGDKPRNFPSQPMIEAQARIVSSYRLSNGLPRSSFAETLSDIDQFQCLRLGNNPRYCIPINPDDPNALALAQNTPGITAPCSGCGAKVE